jgi:alanine racemase
VTPSEVLGSLRAARARIDLDRLGENYRALTAFSPVPLIPVVKADAYGHGAAAVARELESLGAQRLAVAYVEEALALRQAGTKVPIVVLAAFGPGQVSVMLEHGLTPVVSTPRGVDWLLSVARASGRRVDVHLKVDTGMTRLGLTPEQLEEAGQSLADSGLVDVEGLMTHLASADESADVTGRQLDRFDEALERLQRRGIRPPWVHAANSAGLSSLRPTHTLARPGLLLYGLRPRPLSPPVGVKPVMRVSADVTLLKHVPAGTPVSYGGIWVAPRSSRVGTLPIGYADGVPRTDAMSRGGAFLVTNRRAPVIGRVCMDLTMVDLTDLPTAAEGTEAILFGDEPDAWDVAERAGTNAWAVLTSVGPRLPRVFVKHGRAISVDAPLLPNFNG